MEGRLQFINQKYVFSDATEAKFYLNDLINKGYTSLLSEPMVLLYGDKEKPNVLFVIGNKTNAENIETQEYWSANSFFVIDSAQIEKDILANKDRLDSLNITITDIKDNIKRIEDELKQEIEDRINADAALQSELDATQLGAGLASDGSYVKNISFEDRPIHYIAKAESLNDADVKLDIALQELDAEVVKQVVVNGVNANVEKNTASVTIDSSVIRMEENYENVKPILKDEEHLHVHSGDTVSMALAKVETTYYDLRDKVNKEIARSNEVDEKLRSDLDNEIIRSVSTDEKLRTDVDSANKKIDDFLKNAEVGEAVIDTLHEIQHYIDEHGNEAAKMVSDIAQNRSNIAAEVLRATAEEARLEVKISNEITRSETNDRELNAAIKEESNRASGVESILRRDLDSEITRSTSTDKHIEDKFDREIKESRDAESSLTGRIDEEIRRSSDADIAINSRIDIVENRVSIIEGDYLKASDKNALEGLIHDEFDRAYGIEQGLRSDLDNEIARSTSIDTTHSADIAKNKNAIENEITRSTSIDEKLRTDVDSANNKIDKFLEGADRGDDSIDTLKEIQGYITGNNENISNINKSIKDESDRAIGVEGTLRTDVNSANGKIDKFLEGADRGDDSIDTLKEIQGYIKSNDSKIGGIDNEISGINSKIDNEIVRATNAENEISTVLNTFLEGADRGDDSIDTLKEIQRYISSNNGKIGNIDSEISRIDGEIQGLTNTDVELRADVKYAKDTIDDFLKSAEVGEAVIDTLHEIQHYINEHGEAATEMVSNIAKNTEDITTINGEIQGLTNTDVGLRKDVNSANKKIDDFLFDADTGKNSIDSLLKIQEYITGNNENISNINESIKDESDRAIGVEGTLRADVNSANNKIDKFLDGANTGDDSIDTLKEIQGYIKSNDSKIGGIDNEILRIDGEIQSLVSTDEELHSAVTSANTKINTFLEGSDTESDSINSLKKIQEYIKDNTLSLSRKVDKVDNKGLSENDFTTVLKNKLDSISEGAQVNRIERIYVDNNPLAITEYKEVFIEMPDVPFKTTQDGDNILSLSADGELSSSLSLKYDSEEHKITLYGKNGKEISTIDTNDFVKEGIIKKAYLSTKEGEEYLILEFTNPNVEDVEIKVTRLIDIYTAGDGIQLNDRTISISIPSNADNFLKSDATGLYTSGIKDYINNEINVVNGTIDKLKERDTEIEGIARNSFTVGNGNVIKLNLSNEKVLTADLNFIYNKSIVPTEEIDNDNSLLRITSNGELYATNSTAAMSHNDSSGEPQVLEVYINYLENSLENTKKELEETKVNLDALAQKYKELADRFDNVFLNRTGADYQEHLQAIKNEIISKNVFQDNTADPTIEIEVTEGEKVYIRTSEEAIYDGNFYSYKEK